MSMSDTATPERASPPARLSQPTLFYWSVRRELWEKPLDLHRAAG